VSQSSAAPNSIKEKKYVEPIFLIHVKPGDKLVRRSSIETQVRAVFMRSYRSAGSAGEWWLHNIICAFLERFACGSLVNLLGHKRTKGRLQVIG
jgi:hypothetical protein